MHKSQSQEFFFLTCVGKDIVRAPEAMEEDEEDRSGRVSSKILKRARIFSSVCIS